MTKTWLTHYDEGNLSRLMNTISSGRSNSSNDYHYGRYNEAYQVVKAVRDGGMSEAVGRELLVQLIAQIRAYANKRPGNKVVPVPPVEASPPLGVFEDGRTLQQKKRLELKDKWGPLQDEIKAKQAAQVRAFRPPRVIRYKKHLT